MMDDLIQPGGAAGEGRRDVGREALGEDAFAARGHLAAEAPGEGVARDGYRADAAADRAIRLIHSAPMSR